MAHIGLRSFLIASLSGISTAHAATPHALGDHAPRKINPQVKTAPKAVEKHTVAPKHVRGGSEVITVRTVRNAPRLARHVPLGALGNRSEFDTPFSVSSVSAAKIEAMQASDINDVMRYEPGVQANSNGTSTASGSSVRVRGLNLDWTNGYKIDGMAIPYWYIDLPVANFGIYIPA